MPATKREPLGADPLSAESQLRSMVSGEKATAPVAVAAAPSSEDKPLNRTGVYLTDEECEALRVRAFETRRTKTDIIRTALREYLGMS